MTTTTTATDTIPEQAQHIPLGLLRPSPTNPRKRFSPAKITELAESIKKLGGNFQPILARPNPDYSDGNGQPRFEIVAGERRWRACAEAGMPSVLALVRNISDFQALEIQLVENIDREDLHPLEEAEGLKALLRDAHGAADAQGYATAEDLAARIGKSRRWVYTRLALLNLCESAREAFLADKFSASVAGLIARMPDTSQQADATKRILEGWGGEPYSYRQAAEYLHKEFMLALDKAPFDIAASFAHAGPCGQCPKRSGAAPELFDDVKSGDMCQDSTCFNAKIDATHQAQLDAARAAGHTVLSGVAALELMPSHSTLPAGHHWFDKPCPALTDSKAPLRELFGNKAPDVITLDHRGDRIISLVPEAAVKKLLKAKGLLKAAPEAPAAKAGKQQQDQQQKTPPAAAVVPLSQAQLSAAIQSTHRRQLARQLFGALHTQLQQQAELPVAALRMLIVQRMDDLCYEDFQLLYNARGWSVPDGVRTWPNTTSPLMRDLDQRLQALTGRELGEMLIETLVLAELSSEPDLDDILNSDHLGQPTLTLSRELGLSTSQLDDIDRAAYDAAHEQVHAEERARLEAAQAQAQDATAAFVQRHATTPGGTAGKGQVRYRNPATGESWSGRGLQPKWLKNLVDAGHSIDSFAVRGPTPVAPSTTGDTSSEVTAA